MALHWETLAILVFCASAVAAIGDLQKSTLSTHTIQASFGLNGATTTPFAPSLVVFSVAGSNTATSHAMDPPPVEPASNDALPKPNANELAVTEVVVGSVAGATLDGDGRANSMLLPTSSDTATKANANGPTNAADATTISPDKITISCKECVQQLLVGPAFNNAWLLKPNVSEQAEVVSACASGAIGTPFVPSGAEWCAGVFISWRHVVAKPSCIYAGVDFTKANALRPVLPGMGVCIGGNASQCGKVGAPNRIPFDYIFTEYFVYGPHDSIGPNGNDGSRRDDIAVIQLSEPLPAEFRATSYIFCHPEKAATHQPFIPLSEYVEDLCLYFSLWCPPSHSLSSMPALTEPKRLELGAVYASKQRNQLPTIAPFRLANASEQANIAQRCLSGESATIGHSVYPLFKVDAENRPAIFCDTVALSPSHLVTTRRCLMSFAGLAGSTPIVASKDEGEEVLPDIVVLPRWPIIFDFLSWSKESGEGRTVDSELAIAQFTLDYMALQPNIIRPYEPACIERRLNPAGYGNNTIQLTATITRYNASAKVELMGKQGMGKDGRPSDLIVGKVLPQPASASIPLGGSWEGAYVTDDRNGRLLGLVVGEKRQLGTSGQEGTVFVDVMHLWEYADTLCTYLGIWCGKGMERGQWEIVAENDAGNAPEYLDNRAFHFDHFYLTAH